MSGKSDTNQSFYSSIVKTFDRIPTTKKSYSIPNKQSATIQLTGTDKEIFQQLFSPAGVSKNTGNGEVGLFWLFNCDETNIKKFTAAGSNNRCKLNQGGSEQTDPDLKVGNTLLEVKAYPGGSFVGPGTGKLEGLTRFSRFKEFIAMANMLAAVDNLIGEKNLPTDTTGIQNLSYTKLESAAENFCMLRSVILKNRLQQYTVFQKMAENMNTFDELASKHKMLQGCTFEGAGERVGGDEIAKRLLGFLALEAVGGSKQADGLSGGKPGFGNFMVNVDASNNGKIEFFRIDEDRINLDNVTKDANFKVTNGQIKLKFKQIF